MAWCQVEGEARGKARCYEAVVDRDLLRRATLTLLCWEPRGMPAFDGYEIMLGEFTLDGHEMKGKRELVP